MVLGCEALSEREKQTLRLLLVGHDAKSMARHFGLSVHTVNERLRDARRKLGVSSSKEAARLLREVEGPTPESLGDAPLGGAAPGRTRQPEPSPADASPSWRRAAWAIGAMTMLSLVAAMFVLSVPSSTAPPAQTAPVADSEVSRAARSWLALVDAGKWQESWAATGHRFRSLNTVDRWRSASEKARVPLGAVESRTLIEEEDTPAPPHGYRTVRFHTVFANRTATETLSLDHEGTGWKVVGIYIS